MRPLIWSEWWAFAVAAVPFAWLLSIELGTSRRASPGPGEVEVDDATGRRFDLAVGIAVATAVVSSILLTALTIQWRLAPLVAGSAMMIAAGGLSSRARRHLGRFHRNVLTTHADHELVTTGPYRILRHPLYTATVVAFTGIGLVLGNWLSLAVLVVVPTAALIHRIEVEEAMLVDHLGSAYEDFCSSRARLIPFVW